MKKKIYIISGLLLIILVIGFLFYNYQINTPAKNQASDIPFVIASGMGGKTIAENLYDAGLIKSKFFLELYLWKHDYAAALQAGEYVLSPSLSIREIVKVLMTGNSAQRERTIKIIEGWNLNDIATYLEAEKIGTQADFMALTGKPKLDYQKSKTDSGPFDYSQDFSFLADKPKYRSLEGYLFPDTYRIYTDATLDEIVRKMLSNFDSKFTPEMRAEIENQGKTVYEIVTMASIIQKEVRSEKDMKMVSGIFWNRIKNGQALESCATLAYILGENKPQYTYEDTRIDSPYNTYMNRDLPPGPIANPGIEAIKAAIWPTDSNYNFFLSSSDGGETIYSRTFEEHVRNKEKYLR